MATPSMAEHSRACPICFEEYTQRGPQTPKEAPCGHTLCLECLLKISADQNHQGQCPMCRHPYKLNIQQEKSNSKDQFQDTKCSPCSQAFEFNGSKRPKLLPCGNSLCFQCLEDLTKEGKITCSECQEQHKTPEGGVDAFPTNEHLCIMLGLANPERSIQSLSPLLLTFSDELQINLQDAPSPESQNEWQELPTINITQEVIRHWLKLLAMIFCCYCVLSVPVTFLIVYILHSQQEPFWCHVFS